jgi:signal transduction histidine kinase
MATDSPRLAGVADIIQRLRDNELFGGLPADQLECMATLGELREMRDSEVLIRDGGEPTHFYVMLNGELVVTKIINGHEEVLTRHQAPAPTEPDPDGKPMAAHYFTGEMPLLTDESNMATITVNGGALVLAYSKDNFFELIARCHGITRVLLPVLAWRVKTSELKARSQATIAALGTMAAGLAHELNNPASAITRAAGEIDGAVERLVSTSYVWCDLAGSAEREVFGRMLDALRKPAQQVDYWVAADEADALYEWADERGAADAARLSTALADRGITAAQLEAEFADIPEAATAVALDHLTAILDTQELASDLRAAGSRISALVGATKDYANLDRAPQQEVTVTDGIDATLAVLRHKLGTVRVIRAYTPDLPRVLGYPSELNQVWTNLIDNAVDAMEGDGTLTLYASQDAGCVKVEVADSGSGIPADVLPRVFEPFYTTKDIGKGTGLGLHISHQIVTQRHGGWITAQSTPGDTRIVVRLPIGGRDSCLSCSEPAADDAQPDS